MPIDLLAQSAALFCPYRFLKFCGAGRVSLCKDPENGYRDLGAQAAAVLRGGTLGRIYKSAPTVFLNFVAWGG